MKGKEEDEEDGKKRRITKPISYKKGLAPYCNTTNNFKLPYNYKRSGIIL